MNMRVCAACLAAAGLFCLPLEPLAAPVRLAVVIGNNQPADGDLQPLRFADDDAFRNAELFRYIAHEVTLLTRADDESKALYLGETPNPPTRENVLEALDRIVERAEELATSGQEVVVYFVFSGHGSYDAEGRGFLHLEDGKLTTRDLFYHLISRSDSFRLVLMVDACNAGFLVKSRGGAAVRRPAGPSTLEIEKYENVGLVLSSSSTGEVKEWGRYLAGIFSHEVRSALTGAADADGNGHVTFQELAAFVAAANQEVENPALKLTPYIRPPFSQPDMPLVSLAETSFPVILRISLDQPALVTIYKENLVRLADFHLAAGHPVRVGVSADQEHYVAVGSHSEYVVPCGLLGEHDLTSLEKRALGVVSSRGVDRYYLERLFAVPFDRDFATRYVTGPYEPSLVFERTYERPWYKNSLAWSCAGLSLALLGSAGVFHFQAAEERDQALSSSWAHERAEHNSNISTYNDLSLAAMIAAGVSAAGAVVLFVLDRPTESKLIEPHVGPGMILPASPGSTLLEGRF